MARRFPRAKWVLPDVIDPPERVCFTIEVPKNRYHIAAFRGALLNLASAVNWQDDPDHTAKEVAKVWDKVYLQVKTCVEPDISTGILLEDFMSQQIRISPDDSCIIQMWCIDHWEDWYDPRACIPGSIEQPTNGDDLGSGECREWDVSLRGSEKWLLPVAVNEGDTIEITGASGAWNDSTLGWNCVDGRAFFAGICGTPEPAEVGDPLQTANHMRLIVNIDDTWFDAYNQLVAVPGGTSDGQVYFQANDDSLEGNSGTVSFHVKICRFAVAASPITITYESGTGVTTLDTSEGQTEWTISMTATSFTDGFSVHASFSEDIKLTVLSATGFIHAAYPACSVFALEYLDAVEVESLSCDTQEQPTEFTPANTIDNILVGTGAAGGGFTPVVWSMQVKIEKL